MHFIFQNLNTHQFPPRQELTKVIDRRQKKKKLLRLIFTIFVNANSAEILGCRTLFMHCFQKVNIHKCWPKVITHKIIGRRLKITEMFGPKVSIYEFYEEWFQGNTLEIWVGENYS